MSRLVQSLRSNGRRAAAAGATILLLVAGVSWYLWRLNRTVYEERERLDAAARVEVEERALRPPASDGFTLYLNSANVRAAARFQGVWHLATGGGLLVVNDAGGITRRYTTLDGLPENDLSALCVFRGRLFVGTATSGLVAFDGSDFTHYRFVRPAAARISVLASGESELLVGTFDAGLFEFDGEHFSRRICSMGAADFTRVTALLPIDSRLYIGTHDRGLYIWREGRIERVDAADGLPSSRVTGLAPLPGSYRQLGTVAVATDFGVVALDDTNALKLISARPNVTSLARLGDEVWAGLFNGGAVELGADVDDSRSGRARRSNTWTASGLGDLPAVLSADEGTLWALTPRGAFVGSARASQRVFAPAIAAGEPLVSANHITSLALDAAGRLWVGYFDKGIDLISPETGERLSHLEDDSVREINSLTYDRDRSRMLAATSRGVAIIGGVQKPSSVVEVLTREKSGLANNSVAHAVTTPGGSLVLATAGGFTEIAGGRARSLTAFHGLTSNHLYCAASLGSRVFVGSLAGLIEIDSLRVIRTFRTSDSPLSHDWVTALAAADGALYVGTNGGGVDALLPSGEWVGFSDQIGRFEVNQNAMHYDGERLFVGATDRGLLIYNPKENRWGRVNAGLAASNVTAITSDNRFVYVGTINGLSRIDKETLNR